VVVAGAGSRWWPGTQSVPRRGTARAPTCEFTLSGVSPLRARALALLPAVAVSIRRSLRSIRRGARVHWSSSRANWAPRDERAGRAAALAGDARAATPMREKRVLGSDQYTRPIGISASDGSI